MCRMATHLRYASAAKTGGGGIVRFGRSAGLPAVVHCPSVNTDDISVITGQRYFNETWHKYSTWAFVKVIRVQIC